MFTGTVSPTSLHSDSQQGEKTTTTTTTTTTKQSYESTIPQLAADPPLQFRVWDRLCAAHHVPHEIMGAIGVPHFAKLMEQFYLEC